MSSRMNCTIGHGSTNNLCGEAWAQNLIWARHAIYVLEKARDSAAHRRDDQDDCIPEYQEEQSSDTHTAGRAPVLSKTGLIKVEAFS